MMVVAAIQIDHNISLTLDFVCFLHIKACSVDISKLDEIIIALFKEIFRVKKPEATDFTLDSSALWAERRTRTKLLQVVRPYDDCC